MSISHYLLTHSLPLLSQRQKILPSETNFSSSPLFMSHGLEEHRRHSCRCHVGFALSCKFHSSQRCLRHSSSVRRRHLFFLPIFRSAIDGLSRGRLRRRFNRSRNVFSAAAAAPAPPPKDRAREGSESRMAITDDATDVTLSSPLPKLSNSFLGAVETKRRLLSFLFFSFKLRGGSVTECVVLVVVTCHFRPFLFRRMFRTGLNSHY